MHMRRLARAFTARIFKAGMNVDVGSTQNLDIRQDVHLLEASAHMRSRANLFMNFIML